MKTLAVTATPTHRQGSPTWARDHASTRVASATLVAATGDAAFAFVAYVLIAGRYNFETLLQYIATGILGRDAFRSGWTGVGTAAVGFAVHLALAAGFAAAFGLLAGPLLHTRTTTAMVGLAYGAGIWIAMAGVVLPAFGVAHEPVGGGYWWAFLVDHALLIGLPIALLTRARRPRPTTRRSPTHPPCGTPSAATAAPDPTGRGVGARSAGGAGGARRGRDRFHRGSRRLLPGHRFRDRMALCSVPRRPAVQQSRPRRGSTREA